MALENRETLKSYFKKGSMPQEGHFADLVDSFVNKIDDGLSKTIDEGLMLSPIGASPKLMSFFESIEEKNPAWTLEINSGTSVLSFKNHINESVLSLQSEGKVGINTELPEYELDVRGIAGLEGRIGTYIKGKIPADGKWHSVVEQLNGCHAFEIVAGVGKKQRGKYALVVAHAVSTYGSSKAKIQVTQSHYGVRCNQLQLRWAGTTYDYRLEMRSRCDYGDECQISFYISKLWFDEYMDGTI